MAIGIAASLKYFPLGLLLLALWDRRWRFGAGILAGFLVLHLCRPWHRRGWAAYDEWARMLLYYRHRICPARWRRDRERSIFGFWQKFAFTGDFGLAVHEAPLGRLSFQALLDVQTARVFAVATALAVGGSSRASMRYGG